MIDRGVYCEGFLCVPSKGWENTNGQRVVKSLTEEFDASQEQNASLLPSVLRSSSAEIARGTPLRPSSPITGMVSLYARRPLAFKHEYSENHMRLSPRRLLWPRAAFVKLHVQRPRRGV